MLPNRRALLALLGVTASGYADRTTNVATSRATELDAAGEGTFGPLTYRAVDCILDAAPQVTPATPLVVASLSDVQNLDRSSPFGNIAADAVRSRLAQRGMLVSEIRMRSAMRLNPAQGEMMLSREAGALTRAPGAAAILTGTYAVGIRHVYVSLKLVSRADSRVIAAADFAVPRYADVDGLLRAEAPERLASARRRERAGAY